jgi:hypothetical protein
MHEIAEIEINDIIIWNLNEIYWINKVKWEILIIRGII